MALSFHAANSINHEKMKTTLSRLRTLSTFIIRKNIQKSIMKPVMQTSKEQVPYPTYDAAQILRKLVNSINPPSYIHQKVAACLAAQPRESIPLSSTHPLLVKFKQMFEEIFRPYYYETSCEFLCAKVFSPGEKQHQVVTCRECRKECNAVFCLGCFDPQKHKGHIFDRQFIKGGVCDCGDRTKWDEFKFCVKHSFKQDINECKLTPDQMEKFKQDSQRLLRLLCHIYQKMIFFRNTNVVQYQRTTNYQGLRAICDIFGDLLFEQLASLNKNRFTIKRLTNQMLAAKISLKQLASFTKCLNLPECVPIKRILLAFTDLPKTAFGCSKLTILLLYKDQELRKQITIDFINAYSNVPSFATSAYRDLSPQLLSSSSMMSQLAKDGQLPKFALRCDEQWPERYESIQLKAKQLNQRYGNFITDMIYLIRLQKTCANTFWAYLFEKGWIIDMASYTTTFSANEAIGSFNDQYYDLESRFLMKYIRILNALSNDDAIHMEALRSIIPALFDKVVKSQPRGQGDLLFTYERMWAISVYDLLLSKKKQSHFDKVSQEQIKILYKYIGPQNLEDAQSKLRLMLQRLLEYFVKADRLIYKKEDQFILANFEHVYFNWNNLLSSIDNIYFRILLRLGQYINKKKKKESSFDHLDIFAIMINRQLKALDNHINDSFQNQKKRSFEGKRRLEVTLGSLLSFSSRLQQAVYSSLSELVLSCKFHHISKRAYYKQTYKLYYMKLVRSLGNNERLSIEEFTKLARFVLFEQVEALTNFIQSVQTDKIMNESCKGERINFHQFHSLKLKLVDFELPSLKAPLHTDLYVDSIPVGAKLISKTNMFSTIEHCFKRLVMFYQVTDYWSLFVNGLIQAMWSISQSSRQSKQSRIPQSSKDSQSSENSLFEQCFKNLQALHISTNFINFVPPSMKKHLCWLNPELKASLQQQSEGQYESDDDLSDTQIRERFSNYEYHDLPPKISKTPNHLQPHYQLILEELRLCIFCNGKDAENLYQFCLVSQTQFPPVLGIKRGQPVLAFTSCNHYSHTNCFKQYFKKEVKKECPECKSLFNIILPSIIAIRQWKEQSQFRDKVYKKIKIAIKNTRLAKLFMGENLFKALLGFLVLTISAKRPLGILKSSFNTYKILFHLISNQLKVTTVQLNHFKNSLPTYLVKAANEQQKASLLTTHLFQALARNLNKEIQFEDFDKNFKELPPVIQDFIGTIFQNWLKTQDKTIRPFVYKGLDQLSLMPLEAVLEDLYTKHSGLCPCSPGREKDVFYICLLHTKPQELCKFCDSCHLKCMRKHINQHHKGIGEALCVRTDNGDVYYLNNQQEKYRVLDLPSVYTNIIEQKFTLTLSIREKKSFSLNQVHYTKLCQDFYTGRFKIDGRLAELKQS